MRPPRARFKVRYLIGLVAVAALGLALGRDLVIRIGDGWFPLVVSLAGPNDRPIVKVGAALLHQRFPVDFDDWGKALEHDPGFQPVSLTPGRPFIVEVPFSHHTSWTGRELSYAQLHNLVLRVEFEDGSVRYVRVVIPDGRGRRQVSVSLADPRSAGARGGDGIQLLLPLPQTDRPPLRSGRSARRRRARAEPVSQSNDPLETHSSVP